jgi:hypothetical protein
MKAPDDLKGENTQTKSWRTAEGHKRWSIIVGSLSDAPSPFVRKVRQIHDQKEGTIALSSVNR